MTTAGISPLRSTHVRTTRYVVIQTRDVVRAVATLAVFGVVLGMWAWLGTMSNPCRAVEIASFADSVDLAEQGWTVASGETMVPPHCG